MRVKKNVNTKQNFVGFLIFCMDNVSPEVINSVCLSVGLVTLSDIIINRNVKQYVQFLT
jgi:hypothetical protein